MLPLEIIHHLCLLDTTIAFESFSITQKYYRKNATLARQHGIVGTHHVIHNKRIIICSQKCKKQR